MAYKEEQIGWLIVGLLPLFIFLILIFHLLKIGDNPIPLTWTVIFIVLSIIVLLLFYKLTVTVDNEFIKISFGIGLIKKRFPIKDIAKVRKTKSKWYNGWGIRVVKNGMLYNIQGFNALELKFKNKSRRVLIGTKQNSKIENEIKRRLPLTKV